MWQFASRIFENVADTGIELRRRGHPFSPNYLLVTAEFPRLSSTKLSLISFSIRRCLCPSSPTSFQFHKVLDLLLEPEGLLSNSSVLQSLAIVVIVLFPTFSPRFCLRHHPGTLIYKLAAKAWLISTPPPPPSLTED